MNEAKLAKKGWSTEEISHAKKIFDKAEKNTHPEIAFGAHVRLWSLLIMCFAGAITTSIALFPLIITLPPRISVGFFILLGGCLGLLITATLHSLNIHHTHHHHGMSLFILAIIMSITLVIAVMEQKYGGIVNPLLIATAFTIGVLIPYQASKRLHGLN
jgi:hypothetical protein